MQHIRILWRDLYRATFSDRNPNRPPFRETLGHIIFYALTAVIIGAIVGVITMIFGRVLLFVNEFRDEHRLWFFPLLGIAGLAIVWVYTNYAGRARRGMGLLFSVGHGENEKIPLRLVPLTIFATWVTHLFGGSSGREGVAVQIGATVSMQFERFRPEGDSPNILLACGMAAGFAGLFGTPIAATFFALEVMIVGTVFYEALLPALVSAYTAAWVSNYFGLHAMSMPIGPVPNVDTELFVLIIVVGIVYGIVGLLFAWMLAHLRIYLAILIHNPLLRIFIIGSLLGAFFLIGNNIQYAGLSERLFAEAFTSANVEVWAWFAKLMLTAITLGCGFQGGELTPMFVIGASLGAGIALTFGLPVALFAAMGSIAVFAAGTKTVFTPIFIGAEVFGAQGMPFFILVTVVAFAISGRYGIYAGQTYSFANNRYSNK